MSAASVSAAALVPAPDPMLRLTTAHQTARAFHHLRWRLICNTVGTLFAGSRLCIALLELRAPVAGGVGLVLLALVGWLRWRRIVSRRAARSAASSHGVRSNRRYDAAGAGSAPASAVGSSAVCAAAAFSPASASWWELQRGSWERCFSRW